MSLPRNDRDSRQPPPDAPSPSPLRTSTGHKPLLDFPKEIDLKKSYFYLDDYEEGRRSGGVRAWNEAHEAVMDVFYSTVPLVSISRPHEHQSHLEEHSFASRNRGRQAVRGGAASLFDLFGSPTFEERYLEPFEARSVKDGEEVVLKAFADEVRGWQPSLTETDRKECWRKLVPEMRLDDLCKDGGLRRLSTRLSQYFDSSNLDCRPFPHPGFDRKFGLDTPAHVPLSKSSRAFQEEYVLVRLSTLFMFVRAVLSTIVGEPVRPAQSIGNLPDEMTSENAPSIIPAGVSSKAEREGLTINTCSGACSWCHASAADKGLKELKKCAQCLKVGRIELFCSVECRKVLWPWHKSTCGKKASEAFSVPSFNTTSPLSSPLRTLVMNALSDNKDEFWAIKRDPAEPKIGSRTEYRVFGYLDPRSPDNTQRVRTAVRSTAYKALTEADPTSIDVLASCVVPHLIVQDYDEVDNDDAEVEYGVPDAEGRMFLRDNKSKAKTAALVREQFKEIFDLNDDNLHEAIERGQKELRKPGREGELAYYQFKVNEAGRHHLTTMHAQTNERFGAGSPMATFFNDIHSLMMGFRPPSWPDDLDIEAVEREMEEERQKRKEDEADSTGGKMANEEESTAKSSPCSNSPCSAKVAPRDAAEEPVTSGSDGRSTA